MATEFLPLCDVLFNIISLASYFCDVVFDVVTVYTLYLHQDLAWFLLALSCVLCSLLVSQSLSLQWYRLRQNGKPSLAWMVVLLHICQFGVLWRYFKLFVPVDLARVKGEVRDLCMLRLVHAFCEAAPMLLLQLYIIWGKESSAAVSDLNVLSTLFSLFSICWALASFNKNVRRRNMHRLVLTWLGVIFQFLWRLGTVTSRVVALSVYATLYHYWTLVVIGLHWLSMLLWLVSPKNVFHGENMACSKRLSYSMLIAYVYIFCYVNLQEVNPGPKMITFYVTMFLENTLLLAVWLALKENQEWFHYPAIGVVWGGFLAGCLFMALYYGCFHIRRLKHLLNDELGSAASGGQLTSAVQTDTYVIENDSDPAKAKMPQKELPPGKKTSTMFHSGLNGNHNGPYQNGMTTVVVPGVFNCRLNPALKRKKKKPSTFVPLPSPTNENTQHVETQPPLSPPCSPEPEPRPEVEAGNELSDELEEEIEEDEDDEGPQTHETNFRVFPHFNKVSLPFWKKALPILSSKYSSSDHESSVGSRVNIQQKLQEKKQQQLQELKEIEEEIKQGKLKRPCVGAVSASCLMGIPQRKKKPGLHNPVSVYEGIYQWPECTKPRSQTPEILLAPHYLDDSRIYYNYPEPWDVPSYAPIHRRESDVSSQSNYSGYGHVTPSRLHPKSQVEAGLEGDSSNCDANIYKSYRIPSDLDSQISLPRSYTLPREFRFYRRQKPRKPLCPEHFAASNNSSDGDVDSVDDNVSQMADEPQSRSRPYMFHLRQGLPGQMHETKL